jgi:hypothetical protein
MKNTLNAFTRAYITTALWSSTEYAHGECPCCGQQALLSHFPEPEYEQTAMCAAEGCGVREIANPDPIDKNYSESDLAPETLAKMIADCAQFQQKHATTLETAIGSGEVKCGPDFEEYGHAGHDFWLTRNGHGAGFWDGDWPEAQADVLTKGAEAFGECSFYAGDDGKLYLQ